MKTVSSLKSATVGTKLFRHTNNATINAGTKLHIIKNLPNTTQMSPEFSQIQNIASETAKIMVWTCKKYYALSSGPVETGGQ